MALRELEYQGRVLARLDDYLTELAGWKTKADKIEAANAGETDPDLIRPVPDFALKTWEALRTGGKLPEARADIPYSPRQDGAGRSVPNVVFKVPTGGGQDLFGGGGALEDFRPLSGPANWVCAVDRAQ
jgi:type III restriction enzyme